MNASVDGIKVEILKTRDVNPLDVKSVYDNPAEAKEQRVHEFEVGQVVTLNASKARLFIANGWAKQAS